MKSLIPKVFVIPNISADYKKVLKEFPLLVKQHAKNLRSISSFSCVRNLTESKIIDFGDGGKIADPEDFLRLAGSTKEHNIIGLACHGDTLKELVQKEVVLVFSTFGAIEQFISGSHWPDSLGEDGPNPLLLVANFSLGDTATIEISGGKGTPAWKEAETDFSGTWKEVYGRLVELHEEIAKKLRMV